MSVANRPKIVIVGAGFGGLWAARKLAGQPVDVTVIDRSNYHLFLPLLYQVSAAEIEPEGIAYPIRSILRGMDNVSFDMAAVLKIDTEQRKVICEDHEVPYDYLIIASGSRTAFFNVPGAEAHAFQLKTVDQAIVLRNHILSRFEHAAHEIDEQVRARRLTFVIVGGGATGIEFAGAFNELINGPLRKDFRDIDFKQVRVIMIESRPKLLTMMPESLQDYTLAKLQALGVDVQLQSVVQSIDAEGVTLKDGRRFESETVIWTAGVIGNVDSGMLNVPLTRDNRIEVQCTLQVPGHSNIYAVGDVAAAHYQGTIAPTVAPVAVDMGKTAALNILRQINGEAQLAYEYNDKGSMVVIGRNGGVARVGKFGFKGFFAWMAWLLVHLMKLIGFRNRIVVLINWAWDYMFYERFVRLIMPSCLAHPPFCKRTSQRH